jgi:hypothetical protein
MHERLTQEDTTATFVKQAIENPAIAPEAVASWKERKYGAKAVLYDPSDPEANKLAVAAGYKVIYGGAESAGTFENLRRADVVLPAGRVTPSPKPYSEDSSAMAAEMLNADEITPPMRRMKDFAEFLARRLMDVDLRVLFVRKANAGSTYCRLNERTGELGFIVQRLGKMWFERPPFQEDVLALLLHELAHHFERDHLSDNYYKACTRLAGKLAVDVLENPHDYRKWRG